MRNNKGKRAAKSALAAALSLSMSLSGLALPAATVLADDVEPIKTLNFNKGLAEFHYDEEAGTGDANFQIMKSEQFVYAKFGDEIETDASGNVKDLTDANGLVYTGSGSSAKYSKTIFSNQPSTSTDDVKGTALTLDKTVHAEAIEKTQSANVQVNGSTDADATASLDAEIPVGSVAREAMVSKSQVYLSNPFYNQTADAYTLTYWEYIPEGTTTDAGLIAFENGDAVVSLYYDASCETVPTGKWMQIAVVFDANGAKFYVNGTAVDEVDMLTEGGDYALSTITGAERILFGASDLSALDTVYNTKLDDVTFYAAALSAEQIESDYVAAAAKIANKTVDSDNLVAYYSLSDASQFTDISPNGDSVTIEETTIGSNTVKAAHVALNSSNKSAVGLSVANPFVCSDGSLEGITIGYWYKQEFGKRDKTTPNYKSMMIMDDLKYIYNGKNEAQSGEGRSYIYVDNILSASYVEGSDYAVGGYLKNNYNFSVSDEDATALKTLEGTTEGSNWFYITLVATNAGIQMYVNGVAYENVNDNEYGVRFSDGYYNAAAEQDKATTLYGTVGGTNNQLGTQLLTFVGYEDTKLYFGWSSNKIDSTTGYDKTPGSWVYGVSCYNAAMSADEVAALYGRALSGEEPASTDEPGIPVYGDVDGNGNVEAPDALLTLQAVVQLKTLTSDQEVVADVDGVDGVTAADALCILQKVVKLIDTFPVEK